MGEGLFIHRDHSAAPNFKFGADVHTSLAPADPDFAQIGAETGQVLTEPEQVT